VASDREKAAGDCTNSKTLSRKLGLGKSRQRPGVRPVLWRCLVGLRFRTGKKRQGTARTPRRYRANWGLGSRASVLECAQSSGAVWKGCGFGQGKSGRGLHALQDAIARIGAREVAPASWSAPSPLALFGRAAVSDREKAAGDCTHSKTLSRELGLGKSRQPLGVRPVLWRCLVGLGFRTKKKRQGTARTPKRYRANWGSGSRASVLECAQSSPDAAPHLAGVESVAGTRKERSTRSWGS
jgi:hypothetical protein